MLAHLLIIGVVVAFAVASACALSCAEGDHGIEARHMLAFCQASEPVVVCAVTDINVFHATLTNPFTVSLCHAPLCHTTLQRPLTVGSGMGVNSW